MMRYSHKQLGYPIIVMIVVGLLGMGVLMIVEFQPVQLIIFPTVFVPLSLFTSLTVQVDDEYLRLKFGWGLIRKKFHLSSIKSCQRVRNSWLCGWGIRMTWHGWLYNVSGLDAVQINRFDGKDVRIGTNDPDRLVNAVADAIALFDKSPDHDPKHR